MTNKTIEEFQEYLENQVESFYKLGNYNREASYIEKLIRLTNATEFVDFGIWAGLLPKQILSKSKSIKKYIGIDAVELYLDVSKKFINDPRYETRSMLIYDNLSANFKSSFFVDFYNSLDSSSIYTNKTRRLDVPDLIEVPAAKPIHAKHVLTTYPELFSENAYVKMDIDGLDLTMMNCYIDHIIANGKKPKVLQFELWGGQPDRWETLKRRLNQCGYKTDGIEISTEADCATIAVSTNFWWCWQCFYKEEELDKRIIYTKNWMSPAEKLDYIKNNWVKNN